MLESVFGETGGAIAQFILALIVVLALILLVAWLIKRLGGTRFGASSMGKAELEVVDAIVIDQKRRLVLVRHGKLEHLLLIGGGSDEVVERSMINGIPLSARVQARKNQPSASTQAHGGPTQVEPAPAETTPSPVPPAFEETAKTSDTKTDAGLAATLATAAAGASPADYSRPPASNTDTMPPAAMPIEPAKPIENERDAIAQSLDEALHESLLGGQAPHSSAPTEAAESISDSAEPSALPSTGPNGGGTKPSVLARQTDIAATAPPPLPVEDLQADSDLARELQAALGAQNDLAPAEDLNDQSPIESTTPDQNSEIKSLELEDSRPGLMDDVSRESSPQEAEQMDVSDLDIPVTLSGRTDPIPVAIPSRGPAASAVTLTQAQPDDDSMQPTDSEPAPLTSAEAIDDQSSASADAPLIDLSDLLDETDKNEQESKNDDLDEEMRRLLGEIAGGPKTE